MKYKNTLKIIFISIIISIGIILPIANADEFDQKIKEINNQISGQKNQIQVLRQKAKTLKEEISILESQKSSIENNIKNTDKQIKDLGEEIVLTKQKIRINKKNLGKIMFQLYKAEQITLLERIASSEDFSDFLDQESRIKTTRRMVSKKIKEINKQKLDLEKKKKENEQLLAKQKNQKAQVVAKESEKNNLLAKTKNDEHNYQNMIKSNSNKITKLKEEQRIANLAKSQNNNIVAGSPNRGGYPSYLDYPHAQDSLVDPWGMYNRECVSYTAWRVHDSYKKGLVKRDMPYWGGHGNAKQWPSSAINNGISVGRIPRANSVAIWMNGYYGHAMWVEKVLPNGKVWVSQYNVNVNGRYSEMAIEANSAVYIYF